MGFDGIPAGTIRSPRGNSDLDANISPEQWCENVGHTWRRFAGERVCVTCWASEEELKNQMDLGVTRVKRDPV